MTTIIKNASIINEGKIFSADVLIKNERIEKIASSISVKERLTEINADGLYLMPGCIDDQVHFREPGLTHKGEIYTEAKAAVAGGITSYMEMPNTIPNTLTQQLLEEKYQIASQKSLANFSFFMGASNANYDELMQTNPHNVCGLKIFMGSSTGSMLVDDAQALNKIFANFPFLIATHCEDEKTIQQNFAEHKNKYGDNLSVQHHPLIRSAEACYLSSSFAVALAKKHNTRLHILHISTEKETSLFDNTMPLEQKLITAEACIHHLWFCDEDYETKGNFIKWNPAIKTKKDRDAVLNAVLNDTIDIVATDHAPHTMEEKNQPYILAPSGGPLVQHALPAMLELYHQNKITLEKIVDKMCHKPAVCFQVKERGFIREGYFADLVLVNLNKSETVNKQNILYKCGWSPFEGTMFHSTIEKTFVNGNLVFDNGKFDEAIKGQRLLFNRN
jgi:dihydroorotase